LTDILRARELLETGEYNCVLCKGDTVHKSAGRGISPMMEFIGAGLDLRGFSAADTVCGKALALLFAFAGVNEVYAGVMSRSAAEVFERHEIRYSYGELAENIKNRANDGICPMERAVENIDEPARAYEAIKSLFLSFKLVSDAPNGL
jgi:hypothetical protein